MLVVMLPLLAQVNLPIKQKIALVAVFSMGSFVIVAAILTKVFNLSDVYSTVYMLWYIREASTAIYVANLPMIWPLLREWFPYLREMTPRHRSGSSNRKNGTAGSSLCGMRRSGTILQGSVPMSHVTKNKGSQYTMGTETDIERTGSVERINRPPFEGHGILAETTVDIDFGELTPSVEDVDTEKQGRDRTRYEWEEKEPKYPREDTRVSPVEKDIADV